MKEIGLFIEITDINSNSKLKQRVPKLSKENGYMIPLQVQNRFGWAQNHYTKYTRIQSILVPSLASKLPDFGHAQIYSA